MFNLIDDGYGFDFDDDCIGISYYNEIEECRMAIKLITHRISKTDTLESALIWIGLNEG